MIFGAIVDNGEHARRNGESRRLGGLVIDEQVKLGRRLQPLSRCMRLRLERGALIGPILKSEPLKGLRMTEQIKSASLRWRFFSWPLSLRVGGRAGSGGHRTHNMKIVNSFRIANLYIYVKLID
jgi:hypothetical protein